MATRAASRVGDLKVRGRRPSLPQPPAIVEPSYEAPDFSGSRRTRIGSSFIEQFVVGHDASDVLRELVQNEFDGGGEKLALTFGTRELEVAGSGRGIDAGGWERLSVIVGTGNVMGSVRPETVAPKTNGIGSKNFGLRSLFRFGDQIFVRSGGQVALLDLQTQETGRERDPAWRGEKGVRVHVPFRKDSSERLEAFTLERENHSLDLMAAGMPDTLVKLALDGRRRGVREVTIRSVRTGRILQWRQDAKRSPSRLTGVASIVRKGQLVGGEGKPTRFKEIEFSRGVEIPAEHAGRSFPAYYKLPGGRLKIAVSLPLGRRGIDASEQGHFYYPLKAPAARTGCAVSVSAPFELNTDRSGINDHVWNDWLIDQAVGLTMELLKADWFDRHGADAYKALINDGTGSPGRFAAEVAERLGSDECWPTRGTGEERFAKAPDIVLPAHPALDGFLSSGRYLDSRLAGDDEISELLTRSGAKNFSLSSLVRLRCAAADAEGLQTKVGEDANFHFTDFQASLTGVDLQVRFGEALSSLRSKLTKQHKADIRNTASTLNATGELRAASDLMIVDADLWATCPEPEDNRLHPELAQYRAISIHCDPFNEETWLVDAAYRAASAADDDPERIALYRKLLTRDAPFSRRAFSALRSNPVVKNQRGEWVAPADMAHLKKPHMRLLDPTIDAPSKEMIAAPGLLARLRIREVLKGEDLVRFATDLPQRPELVERFENLLADNLRLLTPSIVAQLRVLPCMRARSGRLAAPSGLHLDTPANRLSIGDDDKIVGGAQELLCRKLKIRGEPNSATLLAIIEAHRDAGEAPNRPDLLYPALAAAVARERSHDELEDEAICWVNDEYHEPSWILVGPRTPLCLAEAIPVYRHSDEIGRAYVELGAPSTVSDEHWARFFEHVGDEWAAPVDAKQRRILLEAYSARGPAGLPAGVDDAECLVDDLARLHSYVDLQTGRLVEPDFPALERALHDANSTLGLIERSERSRAFFAALGIRPLSSIATTEQPVFGPPGRPHIWYKPKHSERVLDMLHRPLFARALYEIAYRHRFNEASFAPADLATVQARLAGLRDIAFFQSIGRRYRVGGITVPVAAEVAVGQDRIGLIPPSTKQQFQFLLADALAEVAGANNAASVRGLASSLLPLVLCTKSQDLRAYLDRVGFAGHAKWGVQDTDEGEPDEFAFDVEEDALQQVFDSLDMDEDDDPDPVQPTTTNPQPGQDSQPAPPSPPPPPLPDLDEVTLTVSKTKGGEVEPRPSAGARGGGGSPWLPPTPAEVERLAQLGRRGEELVYRMEIERVRAMGHANPEQFVRWTSLAEPGADHDIRSIDEKGLPRWIEVKSTTGVDGRFEWSRKEFERALRERDRYELWRVYRVADKKPVAKCFPNPAKMIGARRLVLELGLLRANIEGL
jgi:hypothetical protein